MIRKQVCLSAALLALAVPAASVSAATIGLFYNASYVDTSTGGIGEAYNLKQTLAGQGNSVSTFTGLADSDWASTFAANQVVVVPEQELGNLSTALTTAAKTTIANAVASGKGLIVMGDFNGKDVALLNGVFGTSLTGGGIYASGQSISRTATAAGTAFATAPATLSANNGTYPISTASLPSGYQSLYTIGADTAVFTNATGNLVFLAYDWYDASPTGSQDGGWLAVLDGAVASAVPEPEALSLLALGGSALLLRRWRTQATRNPSHPSRKQGAS